MCAYVCMYVYIKCLGVYVLRMFVHVCVVSVGFYVYASVCACVHMCCCCVGVRTGMCVCVCVYDVCAFLYSL